MARPKKASAERLSGQMKFNLLPGQEKEATETAAALGLSKSEYGRLRYLGGTVKVARADAFPIEFVHQIRQIGVSLKQILHELRASESASPPENLARLCGRIEQIIDDAYETRHGAKREQRA